MSFNVLCLYMTIKCELNHKMKFNAEKPKISSDQFTSITMSSGICHLSA